MHHLQTTTSLDKESNSLSKPHQINPLFKSKAQWRCLNSSDLTYINKYKPKMLSMLEITRIDFENIEMRPLCRAIKDLKRVPSLSFRQKELNSKHLRHLINTTNHWKSLGIWDCGLNREILKALRVRRCKDLEYFSIPSELNRFIKEGSADDFFRQIKGLLRLKNLDINARKEILEFELHWRSVKDISLEFSRRFKNLPKFLSKIQHVETLKLQFNSEYNVEVQDGQIWTSFFLKAQNLNNLGITVHFDEDQGTEGIQAFLECFKYFKQITHLQFHLITYGREPIFDKKVFFDCLSANLGALVQLQSLDLKIWVGNIKKPHLLNLISALQHLKNLKNLVLKFSYLESPNEDIISLAECLKNLNNLQVLILFLENHDLNRKSLESFFQNIAHLSLKSFGLVLNPQSMILHRLIPSYPEIKFRIGKIANFWKGKQDPTSLFSPFFAFKLLTTLNLDLTSLDISTEEFKDLSAALKQMYKLSSLTLKLPPFDPANNFEGLQSLLACFNPLIGTREKYFFQGFFFALNRKDIL